MRRCILLRLRDYPDRTLGVLHIMEGLYEIARFFTLELPWRDNTRAISRIPPGKYALLPRQNEHYGDHFIIPGVDGRDGILIHVGNYPTQTEGCILLGLRSGDISGDGIPEVLASRTALGLMVQAVPEPAEILIVDAAS